jgi:hypothetical protein
MARPLARSPQGRIRDCNRLIPYSAIAYQAMHVCEDSIHDGLGVVVVIEAIKLVDESLRSCRHLLGKQIHMKEGR